MKIGFVLSRPTQFDAPFFRHVSRDAAHRVAVFYTDPASRRHAVDPELGKPIDWGEDLLAGYTSDVRPEGESTRWVRRCLDGGPFDLVIVNGYTKRLYVEFARRLRASRARVGLRVDSVDYGRSPRALARRRLLLGPALRLLFDRFFAVGGCARRYLRSIGIPEPRIGLFPYGVDVGRYALAPAEARRARREVREAHGIPANARVVLAVAKFHPRETPWDLVRATPHLADETTWLLLVGDGEERAGLEAEARRGGFDRVRFAGYVPYAALREHYAAADVFVHAAAEERWGVSVHEAIAAGLPVVTSDRVGAGYDLVLPGANGFVYPHGRPDLLADALRRTQGLDAGVLRRTERDLLARWGYDAVWRGLLEHARSRACV